MPLFYFQRDCIRMKGKTWLVLWPLITEMRHFFIWLFNGAFFTSSFLYRPFNRTPGTNGLMFCTYYVDGSWTISAILKLNIVTVFCTRIVLLVLWGAKKHQSCLSGGFQGTTTADCLTWLLMCMQLQLIGIGFTGLSRWHRLLWYRTWWCMN